ncbi:uncharacterized protein [Anser cygnoides]|uniref:uncharacterized protein n=1 Tax=Anser cygnoides TaxID=8845 RepID=UPI0034D2A401
MWIEGCIIGFDEYMNLVLDDAEEIHSKTKSRKQLGVSCVCATRATRGLKPAWVSLLDDDDVGSRYPASQLDHGLEPQEDPRGSTGQVPPWNPAPEPASMGPTGAVLVGSGYSTPQPDVDHEPQVNLPDGTEGKGDPGSQMGSRTEALGDGLGPLTAKDNAEIRKSSPTSPDIIEDIIKGLEEAAPEQCLHQAKDFSASRSVLPASRLGVQQELGGDRPRTADPNWPKGYSIPSDVMLNNI